MRKCYTKHKQKGGARVYQFDFSIVRAGAPIVTLSTTGLAFNPVVRSLLEYPEKIDVGFDEKNNVIGVCAHKQDKERPYGFEPRAKNGWVRISCRDFMRYLSVKTGFEFKPAKQFVAEYDEPMKMLLIKVDEAHIKQKTSSEEEDDEKN